MCHLKNRRRVPVLRLIDAIEGRGAALLAKDHSAARSAWRGRRMSSRSLSFLLGFGLVCTGASSAIPQSIDTLPMPSRIEPSRQLVRPPQAGHLGVLNSTGFFVDGEGHMLTARHAVESCTRVIVAKEKYRMVARVVARSTSYDLALLKIPRTLGLAAVFPRNTSPAVNEMVFAAAYDSLPSAPTRGALIANARVVPSSGGSEVGHLVMDSAVTFGVSGAPVLDRNGLVRGVVSRRTMVNRVLAVGAPESKAFLAANGIRFELDDRPQIAGAASRANRAASVSAQVICLHT
jgi:serine protease Do